MKTDLYLHADSVCGEPYVVGLTHISNRSHFVFLKKIEVDIDMDGFEEAMERKASQEKQTKIAELKKELAELEVA